MSPPAEKFWCSGCQCETLSRVLETRGPRRRRECQDCGRRFTTREVVHDPPQPHPVAPHHHTERYP
jgi:transcriptional regulator NrdR family protein